MSVKKFWVWACDRPAEVHSAHKIEEAAQIYARVHNIVVFSVYAVSYDEAQCFRPRLTVERARL